MKRSRLRAAAGALFLGLLARAQPLVLNHVTVIDATGAAARVDVAVEIEGGKIARIARSLQPREGARVIDATGKFLIPGLWDMHVHLGFPEAYFKLLVANGVTGIREMYTGIPLGVIQQWREREDVPRIAASGFLDGPLMLAGGGVLPPGAMAVGNPQQARISVQLLKLSGVDFIKVYNSLPREAYFAIAREAKTLGIPFAGHVPEAVSPAEASIAGQRSQEHLINILLACSTREEELRAARLAAIAGDAINHSINPGEIVRTLGFPKPEGLFDTYSPEKALALFQTFVKNGTWQTPTLALLKGFADGPELLSSANLRFMPLDWRKEADPRQKYYMSELSADDYAALVARIGALLDRHKKLVGDMHRAGVRFLAGTDTSADNPVLAGFGLHEELALLVESGLTPMEALQTATRNPAEYFGVLDRMGTVEEGKAADLALLDADPLRDIRNTQKIAAVVMRGRYFGRKELDGMLEAAAK